MCVCACEYLNVCVWKCCFCVHLCIYVYMYVYKYECMGSGYKYETIYRSMNVYGTAGTNTKTPMPKPRHFCRLYA